MNRILGQNGQTTLSPNPSPSPPVRERGVDPLELIAAGRHSVEAICRESNMSILELARMVTTPDNLDQLHKVAQLHAIEREMMLGRLKRNALVRLAELTEEVPAASTDEVRAAEVMRKACVNLLRYGASTPAPENARTRIQSDPPITKTLTPASEAEILEALERWGQEKEEYPQIEDSPACPPRRGRIAQSGYEKNENVRTDPGATDSDRKESSVRIANTASNFTDDFARKAGHSCQCHPSLPPSPDPEVTTRTSKMPVPLLDADRRKFHDDGHPP